MPAKGIVPAEDKAPISQRPGTQIDHRFAVKVRGYIKNDIKSHGLLDTSQRVYQCGGEAKNFIYWREKLVSMPSEIWEQIKNECDTVEFIAHDKNVCYRIETDLAASAGKEYDAGIGPRWGVPLALFEVLSA